MAGSKSLAKIAGLGKSLPFASFSPRCKAVVMQTTQRCEDFPQPDA
ncbi:hypothetical protein [Anabaena subtropica]|uniref:Uncharacterized protein n=1 Tax=Anabaena subtropica FACHB-260 TaxID=2692884 RepID=A0ABR8CNY3_9NOST|nr:hypothetical protein [Anabaena subtropica]MBD2344180.1 hypothetical protein [Anabaena subtropica FACHB-260]